MPASWSRLPSPERSDDPAVLGGHTLGGQRSLASSETCISNAPPSSVNRLRGYCDTIGSGCLFAPHGLPVSSELTTRVVSSPDAVNVRYVVARPASRAMFG